MPHYTNNAKRLGPGRLEHKISLIVSLDAAVRPDVPIASLSSDLASSDFIGKCAVNKVRVHVAYPFNPPCRVPLVEVVPHLGTEEETVEPVLPFYRQRGRGPVRLEQKIPGFVANRLHTFHETICSFHRSCTNRLADFSPGNTNGLGAILAPIERLRPMRLHPCSLTFLSATDS